MNLLFRHQNSGTDNRFTRIDAAIYRPNERTLQLYDLRRVSDGLSGGSSSDSQSFRTGPKTLRQTVHGLDPAFADSFVRECLVATRTTTKSPDRAALLQGRLDMLIMRTLDRGRRHGHGVGLSIGADSGDLLHIEAGSLYPAFHRLERQGVIASE
jgi:hypothetical protein